MAAAMATQNAPKVSRLACTFTGPKRSRRVPKAMRTKMVEATAATPAFAIMPLHSVPVVHTHLAKTEGAYGLFSSAVAVALLMTSAGTAAQSVMTSPSLTSPYWQYSRPVFRLLYFR